MAPKTTATEEKEEREAKLLIEKIIYLTRHLPTSIPVATADDRLAVAFTAEEDEEGHWATFNKRFDRVFAADCKDPQTRLLRDVRRGESGMDLVCRYLKEVVEKDHLGTMPLDLAIGKLSRLVDDLRMRV